MSTTATQNLIHHHLNQLTPAQWSDLFRYADEALRRLDAGQLELRGEELTYRVLAAMMKTVSSGDAELDAQPGDFASTNAFLHWLRHYLHRHLVLELGHRPLDSPELPLTTLAELRREFAGQPEVLAVLTAWERPGQRCAQRSAPQPPQRSPAGSESPPNLNFEMNIKMNTESLPTNLNPTRAEAIADGRLLDVTPLAREAGFQIPAALTADLWATYGALDRTPAEDSGTTWDLLWMLRCAATGILPAKLECHPHGETLWFELELTSRGKSAAERVLLKAVAGGGDDGEPVLTILLPHES